MTDKSLEQRVQLIEDELALNKLVNIYHKRADEFDWAGWADTFTDDAVFEFDNGFGLMEGKQNIHDTCKAAMDHVYQDQQHIMINLYFDIDGDTATGTGNLIFAAMTDVTNPVDHYLAGGRYRWKFQRTPQGWRFKHTNLKWLWNNGADKDSVFGGSAEADAA